MKKKIIFLLLIFISNKVFANELSIEKQIIQENPELSKKYWKNLYSIQSDLMKIENKISNLNYILQDNLNNNQFKNKIDPVVRLERAKRHLLLGNTQAAINEVNKNFKYIDYTDGKNIALAHKILFESYRIQNKFEQATNICSKVAAFKFKDKDLFEDKWKMLCSYAFLQESKKNVSNEFKKIVIVWSLNPLITTNSKYSLLSKTFISLALRNIYRNNDDAISYLNTAIYKAQEKDTYLGKSYLALALLYFGKGQNAKSFSIIQDIAFKSSIEKKEYKYSTIDDYTRLLAKLCLARLHTVYGNLSAAETWYEDVLKEKNVTGSDFIKDEKSKVKFEYARVLYRQKKYIKSEIAFKNLIQENTPTNLFLSPFNIKISKIILARILNKSLSTSEEGDAELIELYQMAKSDLNYIQKSNSNVSENYDSLKKNFIPLAALARDYGLESKEAKYFIQSYLSMEKLSENLPRARYDLLNSLNSIDYSASGISESVILSCIEQINKNFLNMKENIFKLDKISYEFWDKNLKIYIISNDNRLEIIRRLNAADDDISNYSSRVFLKDNIYKGNLVRDLILENRKLNRTRALSAGVNFLNAQGINTQDEKNYINLKNIIASSILEYRKSILANEIFPIEFYSINKKIDVYNDSLSKIYALHKSMRTNVNYFVSEPYSMLDKNWIKLIELNSLNKNLLQAILTKLEYDRKFILTDVNDINNKLLDQENFVVNLKKKSFLEFKKYYPIVLKQTINRIKEFNDNIQISFADHNKNIYEISKDNLNDEITLKEQREKWLESIQQSMDWGLFR